MCSSESLGQADKRVRAENAYQRSCVGQEFPALVSLLCSIGNREDPNIPVDTGRMAET